MWGIEYPIPSLPIAEGGQRGRAGQGVDVVHLREAGVLEGVP